MQGRVPCQVQTPKAQTPKAQSTEAGTELGYCALSFYFRQNCKVTGVARYSMVGGARDGKGLGRAMMGEEVQDYGKVKEAALHQYTT